jgi:hypothetical protein
VFEVLHARKEETAMTIQEDCAVLEAVMAILLEPGPAAMASAFGIIMNASAHSGPQHATAIGG